MRICVFGLGYVGTVASACLAERGHVIIGIDKNPIKVDMVNRGRSPIIEPQVEDLIASAVASKRLSASCESRAAILQSELAFVCVGTPSLANGNLDLSQVEKVCQEIGRALRSKEDRLVIAIRSTLLPGSTRDLVVPTLERASGKRAGVDFGVCVNPEFLREGSAVDDFRHPPKTVIGTCDDASGTFVEEVYREVDAPLLKTSLEIAESIKYVDNAWHALKVGFGNEVGRICKALGIDGHAVMDIFCQDRKLNISPRYLKPGFAFGGSCLPKDLRALNYRARALDLELPILSSILTSNAQQVDLGYSLIAQFGKRRVGLLGLSFKAGTDDLRESPMVSLVERLLGKGYEIRIFDRSVSLARLIGANRDFILNQIPHISCLMVETIEELARDTEVLVVGTSDPIHEKALDQLRDGQVVVDLVRISERRSDGRTYCGIAW